MHWEGMLIERENNLFLKMAGTNFGSRKDAHMADELPVIDQKEDFIVTFISGHSEYMNRMSGTRYIPAKYILWKIERRLEGDRLRLDRFLEWPVRK